MKKGFRVLLILLVLAAVFSVTGCKKKKMSDEEYLKLAETQAERNKSKVLLRMVVNGSSYDITAYDMVYFLAYSEKEGLEYKQQQDNYYATMYGSGYDFWEITNSQGVKAKDAYKDEAYAAACYTFLFCQEAKNANLQLEESRRIMAGNATEKFLLGFTAEQRARCGMTEACVRENYERIMLAEQYIEKMTADYKVDEDAVRASIDKEDYRLYKTGYLYVAKYGRDDDLHRVDYTPEEQAARRAAIEDALVRIRAGESMEDIGKAYPDYMYGGLSEFTRLQVNEDPDYINAAMKLKKGEATLFERESSYYVIIMMDNEGYRGYEEAVDAAVEDEKNKGIASLYQAASDRYEFVKTEDWDAITLGNYAIVK